MKPSKDTQSPKGRHRKISGLLIRPREQMRFAIYVFGVGIFILAAFISVFLFILSETIAGFSEIYRLEAELVESLRMSLTTASITIAVFSSILVIGMIFSGLVFAHRFYGPIVPILRLIGELKSGNYSARGALRAKDEMQEVMTALNELAAELETRSSHTDKSAP